MGKTNDTPALGAVRISRLSDETTSPERQRADLERQPGLRYVKIVEDLDVSATKYSPFERPDLGPWLTEPEKLAQYDVFVCWKADRLCRKAADMRAMLSWADEHGKQLVFLQDNLTYDPNASGFGKALNDAMISLVAAFAEIEALNVSARTSNLHAHLRRKLSWSGGSLPFGYARKKEGDRKILSPHPPALKIFNEIADRLIAGESNNAIAFDLNKRGVPAPSDWSRKLLGRKPKGVGWSGQGIRALFSADTALGVFMEKDDSGKRVPARDSDGEPIIAWEPIITPERLRDVRKALDAKTIAKRPHVEWKINPLLDVAKCFECGTNLSVMHHPSGRVYLRCYKAFAANHPCDARGLVPLDIAWGYLEDFFLYHEGGKPVVEGRYVKASPDTARLDDLRAEYEAVSELYASQRSASARERLRRKLDSLDTAMSALESAGTTSGRWETTELGETYAVRWRREDDDGRRAMMVKAGYVLRIKRTPRTNHYDVRVDLP